MTVRIEASIGKIVASKNLDQPVFAGFRRDWTYGQFMEIVDRLTEMLGSTTVPGERVAVVSGEYPIALAALVAVLGLGRTAGFVVETLPLRVIRDQLQRFGPKAVIGPSALISALGDSHDGDSCVHEARAVGVGWEEYELAEMRSQDAVSDSEPLVVLFTSGTTNVPNMVAHTERSLIAAYILTRTVTCEILAPEMLLDLDSVIDASIPVEWFQLADVVGQSMTYLSGIPVGTIGGIGMGLQALLGGEKIVHRVLAEPTSVIEAVNTLAVTSVGVSPLTAQLISRGNRPDSAGKSSSLVAIGIGGSQVPPGLARRLEEMFSCRVLVGYGSTELGGVVSSTRYFDGDDDRWSTIGTPVPGVRFRISTSGELQVKTPAMASGYVSGHGHLISFPLDAGWFSTGDVVEASGKDRLRFVGRQSDVIIRGGRKIMPRTIEEILMEHPCVEQAIAVGTISRVAGEEDISVGIETSGAVSFSELRNRVANDLGRHYTPRNIRVLERIPRTTLGKPDRNAIRQLFDSSSH